MNSTVSPTPPDSSLIAILLVTRTRAGPRINLHYPPAPLTALDQRTNRRASRGKRHSRHISGSSAFSSDTLRTLSASSSSSSSPSPSSTSSSGEDDGDSKVDEEEGAWPRPKKGRGRRRRNARAEEEAGGGWERVLGCSREGLAKLLAPGSRDWHRKRFEVCLGDLCFLGCPVFEKEGGGWGSKRRRKESKKRGKKREEEIGEEQRGQSGAKGQVDKPPTGEQDANRHSHDETDASTDGEEGEVTGKEKNNSGSPEESSTAAIPVPTKDPTDSAESVPTASCSLASQSSGVASSSSHNAGSGDTLAMFNLVFVLLPRSIHEHHLRVAEMWQHVAKPLARALRWQQKRSGWLWRETTSIMNVRERARENGASYAATWPAFQSTSSLATALAVIFNRISNDEIAHVTLGPSLRISVQIPQPISTPLAATPMSPQIPGLSVTTFDPFSVPASDIDGSSNRGGGISPYCALLLLDDAETIAREVESDGTRHPAGSLANFIRQISPTKTLLQLSKSTRRSLDDIKYYAHHLVRFRRARPIPPLHGTHTYIVSPNADMRNLAEASAEYAARFSSLPGLVQMLVNLGKVGRPPQPYGSFIPSSDHKGPYMEILAWLMRGGWVTQLRTFAWVWVSSEVKAEVARSERRAALAASRASIAIEEEGDSDSSVGTSNARERRVSSAESVEQNTLSPPSKAHLFPPRPSSEAGSTSSGLTAVRISSVPTLTQARADDKRSSNGSHGKEVPSHRVSSGSVSSKIAPLGDNDGPEPTAAEFEPSIVLSPHKANALESKWLDHIGASLADEEIRTAWPKLVKYFDGKHAIEEIPVREGWKRKMASPMLMKLMSEGGVLRTVRHW